MNRQIGTDNQGIWQTVSHTVEQTQKSCCFFFFPSTYLIVTLQLLNCSATYGCEERYSYQQTEATGHGVLCFWIKLMDIEYGVLDKKQQQKQQQQKGPAFKKLLKKLTFISDRAQTWIKFYCVVTADWLQQWLTGLSIHKASSSRPITSARTHIQTHTWSHGNAYTHTWFSLPRQPVTLCLFTLSHSLLLSTNQTYCITTTNTRWLTAGWNSHKLWRWDNLAAGDRAWCSGSFESRG